MKNDVREKALDALVDDARRQHGAQLDWDATEASLLSRLEREGSGSRSRARTRRSPWLLAAAAVVTAVSVGTLVTRKQVRAPAPRELAGTTTPASSNVDGDALSVGASIVANAEPIVVVHRDHAVWTLAPNGAAHVESVGDVIAVALDRGSLEAKVTKSPRPESFVVRVERTRIAVHGTAFRVERRDGTTRVSVTEGVVAVGPIAGPSFELPAPGSALVTFDGERADAFGADDGSGSREALPPREGTVAAAKERGKVAVTPRGDAPREANAELGRLVDAVRACFGENSVSRGNLRVTVSTRLSLRVAPDGRVSEARFDPPLVPAVQTCVEKTIRGLAFPKSTESVSVERVLELEH